MSVDGRMALYMHLQQQFPDNIALKWALVLSCRSVVGAAAHLGSIAISCLPLNNIICCQN
jgi:hypothetical protein